MKASPILAAALLMMTSLISQASETETPVTITPAEPAPVAPEIRTQEVLKIGQRMVIDLFTVLDGNDDGRLSKNEVSDRPALSRYFGKLDSNQDGFLNRDEFAQLQVSRGFHFGPGLNRIHSV